MDTPSLEERFQLRYDYINTEMHAIERAIYTRNYDPDRIIIMLGRLVQTCESRPHADFMQLNIRGVHELCTRFASVYVRLFADMGCKWSFQSLLILTMQKRFMSYVFDVSGYGSAQFVLRLLQEKAKEKKTAKLTDNQAAVRAVLLGSVSDIDMADLVQLSLDNSETAAMLCIGLLLDRLPSTLAGEASRRFLLEECKPYAALQTSPIYASALANVWMLCSYSTTERKHEIKRDLNAWFARMFKAKGCKVLPTGSVPQPGNTQNKPVMAVVAESFNSYHAMYRWYAPIIKQLKERYFMVLVALPGDVDEPAKALFDRFVEMNGNDEMNLQPVLSACTPDLVYFMSVGMRAWAIHLANVRWAPLQVMSFGHPATTHSSCIDLAFINTRTYAGPGVIQENLLVLEAEIGSLIEPHQMLAVPPPPVLPDDFISIAVPCNVMKINLSFLTALKEIERQAQKPVRYVFFPNEFGVGHLSTEARLHTWFPNALVARRTSYDRYLELLNQNHFALSPFPFGNATSTIDCMVVGLPSIGLLGKEPHSRSDFDVLAAFGLEDYCIATTVDDYVNGALQYINNPEALNELRALVASKNFMEQHKQEENPLSQEFVRALQWAVRHQEEVVNPRGLVFEAQGRWSV